jgi:hypothetical protein
MGSRETHTTIYNLGEGTGTAAITSKLTKKSEAFLQSLLAKNSGFGGVENRAFAVCLPVICTGMQH